nr:hypothetical protein [Sphingobium chlorophenolicum]
MAIPVTKPKALLADKGYDGDAVRETCLYRESCRSSRPSPIAANPFLAIFAATGIATASSACSATSSSSVVSPPATTNRSVLRQISQSRCHPQMSEPSFDPSLIAFGNLNRPTPVTIRHSWHVVDSVLKCVGSGETVSVRRVETNKIPETREFSTSYQDRRGKD